MEPVFVFLVQEYRLASSADKARALWEIFCQENAPARLDVPEVLPPRNSRLLTALRPMLSLPTAAGATGGTALTPARPAPIPPHFLFDFIAEEIRSASPAFAKVTRRYKPSRTPIENLPGGKMSATQRQFVERVWEPVLRPKLVRAGFWRLATVA
jgi:hypothetical protein